jgi:transcription initiation factor TFIID TATA-box-binding protein
LKEAERKQSLPRLNSDLKVVNLVATAELGQRIDLGRLVGIKGFLYDMHVYHCAYLKDQNTKAKVSIFSSGKMISIGAKDIADAECDLDHARRKLAKLGLVRPGGIKAKVQNIVATSELGRDIDLEDLVRKLPNIIYEPEQFPGAIYYAKELEGASILIFANGKLVFAGLKSIESLEAGRQVMADIARVMRARTQ